MGRSKRSKKKEFTEYQLERIQERNRIREEKAKIKKERRQNKNNTKMEEKFLVAIYDSLRRNCDKNDILSDGKYMGSFNSLPIFNLWDIGGKDPVLELNGFTSVKFEVYEVNKKTLDKVDNNQNFVENNEEYSYMTRQLIMSPFGRVWTYFLNDDEVETNELYAEAKKVSSGDWLDYLETVRKFSKTQTSLKLV